ncbi:High-affinity branched-chain amino acid transport ATP-binding protein LivF [wastewater metagenome]|uniref:High-affinity branched-chain amino acid transport ATP-binding protein LivF n=2 Tax=unclassified sequences TaxID=12908 RepID=A0A5B8REN5_9ZZZZ|nr:MULTISPECIES: ABC transporter ATP-binding protein [Arhodomonas]MCS4503088.1 ABC transporter ATP-binding protein [Arhodomonas aquaeolei]QEA05954.1 high-affinity branched-chain amino acid transport ATP-binding protein LivF [uncultured organism]
MSETVLSVRDIEAFYGKIQALHGVTLEVRKGQIVALLGSNGAGKTTTLKTISGLVRAAAGEVQLQGKPITTLAAHNIARLGVVHVPEGRHVLKGLSVKENLELGAFTVRDAHVRAERMAHVFELFPRMAERRHQDASLLSGGEQQMLAIGRALMHGPEVLLLDEPSMGLAPKLVTDTMRIVKRLNETGVTILLVEQNARLALRLAHYGYVLENGQVRMQGSGEELRADERIIQAYLGGAE